MKNKITLVAANFLLCISLHISAQEHKAPLQRPNVILIYADDLGYGDLSCYGATQIQTPNLDLLAKKGIRFTNGHATSSTCTPSRFALMTGKYPWRKKGTGILPGDAGLIVPTDSLTLPKVFKQAGYTTAIVGKWHLGLGPSTEKVKNWNVKIAPGPNETGFDYSFIFPATADRVPTVFMENGTVVGLDPNDPIEVSYGKPIGDDPTAKEHPELTKVKSWLGHNQTIVNGLGRIGYMTGGKMARWADEELSLTFLAKARDFVDKNEKKPFFLYYALTEPHAPRIPPTMLKGKSKIGTRGDVILAIDYAVGEIMKELKYLGIDQNTIIIFSSDNGPVMKVGYNDGSIEKLSGHKPAGPLRGEKSTLWEGGTREPFIVNWPAKIKPKVSNALVSQMDLIASFSAFFKQKIPAGHAPDSQNVWGALTGTANAGRSSYVEGENFSGLAVVDGAWKLIVKTMARANVSESDGDVAEWSGVQLFNLKDDLGEKNNLADKYPDKVAALKKLLQQIKDGK